MKYNAEEKAVRMHVTAVRPQCAAPTSEEAKFETRKVPISPSLNYKVEFPSMCNIGIACEV
jgi:hypothetical protein